MPHQKGGRTPGTTRIHTDTPKWFEISQQAEKRKKKCSPSKKKNISENSNINGEIISEDYVIFLDISDEEDPSSGDQNINIQERGYP